MAGKSNVISKARAAKRASRKLATLNDGKKRRALKAIAKGIRENSSALLKANEKDIREAKKAKLSSPLLKRLMVDETKIAGMADGIEAVAKLKDPVGRVTDRIELDTGLLLEKVTCPIGVIGAVFESRPDAVPQIAALCLKSGNGVLLKGGAEAKHSNRILVDIIAKAAKSTNDVEDGWIQLIETRAQVLEVLGMDDYIDMLVPRGSNAFVKYIKENTQIPVLGHADGICHVFVDKQADVQQAVDIAFDSKTQYPAVCNAMETLLVHSKVAAKFLPEMVERFKGAKVEVRGCGKTRRIVKGLKAAKESDWSEEYLDLIISVKVVDSLDEGIDHINKYGSGHTDAIVTNTKNRAIAFQTLVDSACTFHNASTRFSDGYRFGLGAELGISTNKTHARGPVGVEGLVIYKYCLTGHGQVVSDYGGKGGKKFTHKKIPI